MPEFAYYARSPSGQQTRGTVAAASRCDALCVLETRGLLPVRIEAASKAMAEKGRPIKKRLLARLYTQLADLLHAGVPLLRSLEILERQSVVPALARVLKDVREEVTDGTSLADALAQHPRAFDELTVSMVRAGQEGGFLEDVLKRIAKFTDHQEELKAKVLGAMAYPVFLLLVGTTVVLLLLIFLVPRFEEMFHKQQAAGELPRLTTLLLGTSRFCWETSLGIPNVLWSLACLVGLWLAFRRWARSESGRCRLDRWKLSVPVAGGIWQNLAISRFSRILATLLHNGIPLLTALRIAKDSTGNRLLTQALEVAAQSITDGKSLARPLAASGCFPLDLVEMVAVGEESNNLEGVLFNIADSTERSATRYLELLVKMLEPVLLLVLAGITLVVVLALLLPFLSMGELVS